MHLFRHHVFLSGLQLCCQQLTDAFWVGFLFDLFAVRSRKNISIVMNHDPHRPFFFPVTNFSSFACQILCFFSNPLTFWKKTTNSYLDKPEFGRLHMRHSQHVYTTHTAFGKAKSASYGNMVVVPGCQCGAFNSASQLPQALSLGVSLVPFSIQDRNHQAA